MTNNHYTLLDNYINSMIENIDKKNFPNKINLVVDGGAFNGAYTTGCLYYIKQLETLNITKVNYISGCSIGAILGFMYLTDNLELAPLYYKYLINKSRSDIILNCLPYLINYLVKDSDLKKVNNRLFISYYNVETLTHTIVSKYNTREELIDCLIRSSYVPFAIDGKLKYKDKYCDGLLPHIFNKGDVKTIFISIINIRDLKQVVYIKNDKDIWDKLFKGLDDINLFFSFSDKKVSFYCSYIDKWNTFDFIVYRFRELISLIFVISLKHHELISKFLNIIGISSLNLCAIKLKNILILLIKNILSYIIL